MRNRLEWLGTWREGKVKHWQRADAQKVEGKGGKEEQDYDRRTV